MTLFYKPWHDLYSIRVSNDTGSMQNDITPIVIEASLSYTMDMASQLSFTVVDLDWKFSKANWFMLRRIVRLTEKASGRTSIFEIAAVAYEPGDIYNAPRVGVECRTRSIQLMKRDKKRESFKSMSATQFANMMALRHGLRLYGESINKAQTIVKSRSSNSDESTWSVLQRLAGEHQFVLFESAGTLFFCSERFLLGKLGTGVDIGTQLVTKPAWPGTSSTISSGMTGQAVELLQNYFNLPVTGTYGSDLVNAVKSFQSRNGLTATGTVNITTWDKIFGLLGSNWNYIPINYPPDNTRFIALAHPSVRKSDDNPYDAEGEVLLERTNGVKLRPGMTMSIRSPNPDINGAYLINSVEFDLGGPNPVRIGFRTPSLLTPQN